MRSRRGATNLSGVIAIDKPAGLTSHDVVGKVRSATGERRVGHAGTLDPMATGLLVVLVGPATRLAPYLTSADKTYLARIVFGAETDTDDAEGAVTARAAVPGEVADPIAAAGVVASLVGTHEQVPPSFSAIKRGGVTAYMAARKGDALNLEPRTIEISSAKLLGVECAAEYAWDVEFAVSKGTYIRALARDLGRALGTAAHLGALRRTHSGALTIEDACTLEEVAAADDVRTLFADPFAALGLPRVDVDAREAARASTGASIENTATGTVALSHDGLFLGVYSGNGERLRPLAVIPGGVRGGE